MDNYLSASFPSKLSNSIEIICIIQMLNNTEPPAELWGTTCNKNMIIEPIRNMRIYTVGAGLISDL